MKHTELVKIETVSYSNADKWTVQQSLWKPMEAGVTTTTESDTAELPVRIHMAYTEEGLFSDCFQISATKAISD